VCRVCRVCRVRLARVLHEQQKFALQRTIQKRLMNMLECFRRML
jgi:hypothetical protein